MVYDNGDLGELPGVGKGVAGWGLALLMLVRLARG